MKNKHAAALGKRGGKVGGLAKSPAKIAAAQANGAEGGRPSSTAWEYTVENAIKADVEWWEYRNGSLEMWGDLTRACDSASRYVFEKTGRRIKAWVSLLPNVKGEPQPDTLDSK